MSSTTSGMGRPSIFRDKTERVQGKLSSVGSVRFERAKARLARLAGRATASISDGDTIEYLSRGHEATEEYLKGR